MKYLPSIKLGHGIIVFVYSLLVFGIWLMVIGF